MNFKLSAFVAVILRFPLWIVAQWEFSTWNISCMQHSGGSAWGKAVSQGFVLAHELVVWMSMEKASVTPTFLPFEYLLQFCEGTPWGFSYLCPQLPTCCTQLPSLLHSLFKGSDGRYLLCKAWSILVLLGTSLNCTCLSLSCGISPNWWACTPVLMANVLHELCWVLVHASPRGLQITFLQWIATCCTASQLTFWLCIIHFEGINIWGSWSFSGYFFPK